MERFFDSAKRRSAGVSPAGSGASRPRTSVSNKCGVLPLGGRDAPRPAGETHAGPAGETPALVRPRAHLKRRWDPSQPNA